MLNKLTFRGEVLAGTAQQKPQFTPFKEVAVLKNHPQSQLVIVNARRNAFAYDKL